MYVKSWARTQSESYTVSDMESCGLADWRHGLSFVPRLIIARWFYKQCLLPGLVEPKTVAGKRKSGLSEWRARKKNISLSSPVLLHRFLVCPLFDLSIWHWHNDENPVSFFSKKQMKLKLKQKEDLKAEHRRTTVPGSDWSGVGLGSPPRRWSATTVPRRPDVHPTKPEERLTSCRLIGGTSCPSSLVSSGSTPRWWRGFQVLFADTHTHTQLIAQCLL